MKAAVLSGYDKRGRTLEIWDVPMPEMKDNDVLVKIRTAGVNPLDNMIIRGEVRMIVPYSFPLVMGNEFVGIVEKTGKNVRKFLPGERVYGRMELKRIGAFAEYAAIDQDAIAGVPEYFTDEEAASVPLTALTAMQALALMKPKKGESIFISGGTGSLGAMAIPVAKSYGLTVMTNGNGASEERVRRLGADRFIDYKKEDYAKVLSNVDYVLDTLGDRELEKEFSILKDGGSLVSLRGMPNGEFAARNGMPVFKRLLLKAAGRKYDQMGARRHQKYYFVFVHEDGAALERISEIFGQNRLEASVDGVYTLNDVNEALKKVASGGSKGKTILKISD
ncbi:MAG: NADP-dependent oxidoreductase [Oscillospiraceae bacterium]|nr:NADP-dependent oxidoreductase [Oscillospiraceae bacterium]